MNTITNPDDARAVNLERTSTGRVRPVCESCGRRGRPVVPNDRGGVDLFDLGRGWWVAPYPPTLTHADGSTGTLFTCPGCSSRLARGEALWPRVGLVALCS